VPILFRSFRRLVPSRTIHHSFGGTAAMSRSLALATIAYLIPTFALGFAWHLRLFERTYRELEIYRPSVIIPFGFLAILVQGVIFAWVYLRLVADPESLRSGLAFAAGAGLLSWTFTTLAVGAKHRMTSVPRFVRIETAFTLAQFALVGILLPLAVRLG
jgi:hypothetical protein